jgi:hypothetical protein
VSYLLPALEGYDMELDEYAQLAAEDVEWNMLRTYSERFFSI